VNFVVWTKLHKEGEARRLKIEIKSVTGCCNTKLRSGVDLILGE
jgi:hypothetical protein